MTNSKRKRDRFLRVAERRTNVALEALRLLGKCSEPNAYTFTQEEAQQILHAIDQSVAKLKVKFKVRGKVAEPRFAFGEKPANADRLRLPSMRAVGDG